MSQSRRFHSAIESKGFLKAPSIIALSWFNILQKLPLTFIDHHPRSGTLQYRPLHSLDVISIARATSCSSDENQTRLNHGLRAYRQLYHHGRKLRGHCCERSTKSRSAASQTLEHLCHVMFDQGVACHTARVRRRLRSRYIFHIIFHWMHYLRTTASGAVNAHKGVGTLEGVNNGG